MQSEMEFVKFLGKGSYGSVNLLRYPKPDGSMFYNAVKITDSQLYYSLSKEFHILKQLKGSPQIIQCFGDSLIEDFNYKGDKVYKMVMEYASGGTLSSSIERNKKLSESMIKDFTRMILQGLVSIHSQNYVHCDLKPDNLLIFPSRDYSYELKISGFGCSREVGEEDVDSWEFDYPYLGTPVYMSPESVHNGLAEKALDLSSLGCIVLEMYTGESPWSKVEFDDLTHLLLAWNAPEIPDTIPCDARMFLETCFASKPEERGSALDLLMHRFLSGEQKTEKIKQNQEDPMKSKIIAPKLPKFKKVQTKPRKMKPPASSFVTAQ